MKKVDVLQELKSVSDKTKEIAKNNDVVKQVKGLLGYDEQKDERFLRALAPNSTFARAQEEKSRVLVLEEMEKVFQGEVYMKDQLVSLGQKYRLKLLHAYLYKGTMDAGVIPEIRNLERAIAKDMTEKRAKRENTTVDQIEAIKFQFDDHQIKTRFFILAPESCFNLEKNKAFNMIVDKDPVLFYTEDGIHFRLIKKWGSDFTIFRRLKGWGMRSELRFRLMALALPFTATVMAFVLGFSNPWLLFILLGNFPILFAGEFEKDYFGRSYVTSEKGY